MLAAISESLDRLMRKSKLYDENLGSQVLTQRVGA